MNITQHEQYCERHGHILMTYEEYSNRSNQSMEYVIQKYAKYGFAFWSRNYSKFVICYNEALPPEEIYITIAHEIAHIELGHVAAPVPTKTEKPSYKKPHDEALAAFTCEVGQYALKCMSNHYDSHKNYRHISEIEAELFASVLMALNVFAEMK